MSGICQKCLRAGYDDAQIGQPCESCKDGVIERQPQFKELVDVLPEPMTCGRRHDTWAGSDGKLPVHGLRSLDVGQDRWQKFKSIDNRVCSFCGSLHPDDFFRLVHEAATAPEDAPRGTVVDIEQSDKNYKVYVNQPGVRNAHEGGIKFYMQHLPRKEDGSLEVTDEQNDEFLKAKRLSGQRFERYMKTTFPMQY